MKKIRNDNQAVAGVVVALLFIGLIFSIIGFIQSVEVPQWMEQKEAEHMDEVALQFSQLKFAVDTLSVSEQPYSLISTPITLGSKEMPFLFSSRSYGTLEVIPDNFRIIFTNIARENISIPISSLRYTSDNAYYLEQSYIFENGAVILSQDSGDIITVQPNVNVDGNEISIQIIRLVGQGTRATTSGFGTYPVQTRFSDSKMITSYKVENITIYNSHLEAWKDYFDNLLSKHSIFNYIIENTTDGNGIKIKFFDINNDDELPNIFLLVSDIKIQIAPGWTE